MTRLQPKLQTKHKPGMNLPLIALLTLLSASHAHAQSAGPWTLTWSTLDAGGGSASSGPWSLTGTIGQPDAGAAVASPWTLTGGYWTSNAPPPPTCVADVDDGTGSGIPDGGVTIDDLLFYLFLFEVGDVRSDVDDGSATGTPDGGVTIDDLLYYLFRFENGC